jgi:type I restriction enzyme M protein
VSIEEIATHGFILSPARFVGAADLDEEDEPFPDKIHRLAQELRRLQTEGAKLDASVAENLKRLGYDS